MCLCYRKLENWYFYGLFGLSASFHSSPGNLIGLERLREEWKEAERRVEGGQIRPPATKLASFAPRPLARSHVIIDSASFHCSHGY